MKKRLRKKRYKDECEFKWFSYSDEFTFCLYKKLNYNIYEELDDLDKAIFDCDKFMNGCILRITWNSRRKKYDLFNKKFRLRKF